MVEAKEPIAIIGSACRLPGGSNSPSKLWDLLRNPLDVLRKFPCDRLNLSSFIHANGQHHGSTDVKNKSYILSEDPRLFDASFFNISPREADGMDPQQRLLLEVAYEALESAGCTVEQIKGSLTSVYVGSMTNDYYDIQIRDTETMPTYTVTGTSRSLLANRISHFFDLKGESITIDTACSSSLVALHQAVQSLRCGHSQSSIVAGANLLLDPAIYIAESKIHMLSPGAQSKMWDDAADGYARGDGVAAILLKPLSQALQDGDHVESLIRETLVNSDGRTKGITMPSATAQSALIRRTYHNAGLDPLVDRCQFFECHGTGTQAGDPQEAQAIEEAFFSRNDTGQRPNGKLFVGSIKTVMGHTEGCAGLAGVLKASLALQHRTIPPNIHFKHLNPKIAPFYDNLEVATILTPWPKISKGPARASVNSFGFGGTNAHAIIESYESELDDEPLATCVREQSLEERFIGPLTFSAKTKSSLNATIKSFTGYIKSNPSVDLKSLAHVLHCKRSIFPVKTYFSGTTRQRLLDVMEKHVQAFEINSKDATIFSHMIDSNEIPGTLGIFTGQGAQWAAMGQQLIIGSPLFRKSITACENALACLVDAPSWSLKQELLADKDNSHLSKAAISQPLCTAVQLALVDFLSTAGIRLDAVVGHSSGEIAAAYAAGIISARDAMCIAYYRGYYAKLARGNKGTRGSMMAAGLSLNEGISFCTRSSLSGRIGVAASNSPELVTLSGDIDTINEAQKILEKENTFAKLLNVDTAYHSYHMLPCAKSYLDSLKACNIKVNSPRSDCTWISSVRGDVDLLDGDLDSLKGQYWVDNMLEPVLFSQALECSLWNGGPFDMVLEIGPHPALKGPTMQTIKAATGKSPPYKGLLSREHHDVEAFSDAFGYVWSHLGRSFVYFDGYQKAFEERYSTKPKMIKDLPTYAWDHDRIHWIESRLSRDYRLCEEPFQELLGRRIPNDSANSMRWRNLMRLSELPWLRGHEFRGQIVFPGTGYVVMALEASRKIANGRSLKLIEVLDFSILQSLILEESSSGVETVFTIRVLQENLQQEDEMLHAEFECSASPDALGGSLARKCTGRLLIHFGQPSKNELPPRSPGSLNILPVDMERFTSSLLHAGWNYRGLFSGLKSLYRTMGHATASARWAEAELGKDYMIHPAFLDSGLQSLLAAFASPASEALRTAYLPISIRRILVDPNADYHCALGDVRFDADAFVTESSLASFQGDVHLFDANENPGIQMEGLTLKSISEPQAENDRLLFTENKWEVDVSYGLHDLETVPYPDGSEFTDINELTALHYFQAMLRIFPQDVNTALPSELQRVLELANISLKAIRIGDSPIMKSERLQDILELILALQNKLSGQIDFELANAVGENSMPGTQGKSRPLTIMSENHILEHLYTDGHWFAYLNHYIARVVKRITHKYPQVEVLEIGAGPRATAKSVLDLIGTTSSSYTCTDCSSTTLEKAKQMFAGHHNRLCFRVLDIEKNITDQGLDNNSYDVVIASHVLQATLNLGEALQNTRSLLRPGGFLILMEATSDFLRVPFLLGGLPRRIVADESRHLSSAVSPAKWDELLYANGFSGVDSIVHDMPAPIRHYRSVIVTQAVNDKFSLMRNPLASVGLILEFERLLIIGGTSLPIAELIRDIESSLAPWKNRITVVKSIDDLDEVNIASGASVICLAELDRPLFSEPITPSRLTTLQGLFSKASNILWLTTGRLSEVPHSNMTVGIGRALTTELPHLNLQFVDISKKTVPSARKIVKLFLQLVWAKSSEFHNHDVLWVTEPELAICGETVLIPRVVLDKTRNDRLNAVRRLITTEVNTDEIPVRTSSFKDSLVLQIDSTLIHQNQSGYARIHTTYSLALPSKESRSSVLCTGKVHGTDETAFAITQSNSSTVEVPSDKLFIPEPNTQTSGPEILKLMAIQLVIDALRSLLSADGPILFYEADEILAEAITHDARWQGREIFFASSKPSRLLKPWISLHPQLSERAIKDTLPNRISYIFDFSKSEHGSVVASVLKKASYVRHFDSTLLDRNHLEILSEAYATITGDSKPRLNRLGTGQIIPAQALNGAPLSSDSYPMVVDWTQSSHKTVAVRPLKASRLISPSKTYFLVGLTGEMGQSICRWMVNNGARYIALASRNAKAGSHWLKELRNCGAIVNVYTMDITNRDSVRATYATISDTMPPIAGVCNAAMVLSDKLFVNMTTGDINTVLGPKVNGTRHLDEIFSFPSLDFFILFSSIGSVIGNAGQSNYHAANLFMTSVAAQRRSKGLAASVMSIGMVVDIGYVRRAGRTLEDHLRKLFYMPLSEPDVHQLFAEAIIASPANSKSNPEIIMGIELFKGSIDEKIKPSWYTNPRFSHLRVSTSACEEREEQQVSSLHIRHQLESAETEEIAVAMIQDSFSSKLRSMLHLASDTVDANKSLLDLGCDSLLAVEVRTWLLKEIQVDIPILYIMGGHTVAEISHDAARKYMAFRPAGFAEDTSAKEIREHTEEEEVPSGASESAQSEETNESSVTNLVSPTGFSSEELELP